MHLPTAQHLRPSVAPRFTKWQPSELMEWAKFGHANIRYDLTRSGIPLVPKLSDIPGGPYLPELCGTNYAGHEGLKAVIANMYHTSPQNVLIAQGASECNFLIAGAALSGGGTAIVETPCYQPMLRSIEVWADRIIRLPRRREDRYQPDPDEFRRLLTPDTKLVMLTNLHNPSHVALDKERLREIVSAADAVGADVVCDEVYLRMTQPDHCKHGFAYGTTSTNCLGKTWGLDNLRVGWSVGPEELIHRAYRLNNLLGVNQPYMTEDLAFQIFSNPSAVEWLTERARKAAGGWKYCEDFLRTVPELSYVAPDGGFSAYLTLPGHTDEVSFLHHLIEEYSTAVVPGTFYEDPGSIRVSYSSEPADIIEGFSRLAAAIQALK